MRVEATTGFEPVIGVLQTPALPLGYVASVGWCRGGDLNPYARRHGPLKTACLPIPPPRLVGGWIMETGSWRASNMTLPASSPILAGVEGLEPPTCRFGDGCSSN